MLVLIHKSCPSILIPVVLKIVLKLISQGAGGWSTCPTLLALLLFTSAVLQSFTMTVSGRSPRRCRGQRRTLTSRIGLAPLPCCWPRTAKTSPWYLVSPARVRGKRSCLSVLGLDLNASPSRLSRNLDGGRLRLRLVDKDQRWRVTSPPPTRTSCRTSSF